MRILIAGLGSIGRRHLSNLLALGAHDVLLLRTGKSTMPADEIADYPTVSEVAAGLAWGPEAVIVSTPTSLHLDVAIAAAHAGCHLLLEKPLSDSMDRVDDLRQAVLEGRGRVLMGFQYRHHPTLRMAKSIVDEGDLGTITAARAHWGEYLPDWHPWEDFRVSYAARRDLGGGALLTLCHPFDYLRWIFGEVVDAAGVLASGLGLDVEAVVEAAVAFESGVLAGVHLDYLQRPPEHRLEIVGERGRVRWNGRTGELEIVAIPSGGRTRHSPPQGFDRNAMFLSEMGHFLDVVAGRADPICTLDDGIRVQEVLERLRRTSRRVETTGRLET
jgi:predicted dehydrogenase